MENIDQDQISVSLIGKALSAHEDQHLQNLMNCFFQACEDFRLTINVKKTNIMSQDTENLPALTINNYQLDVVKEFTYLGSTMTDILAMDSEISRRIGRPTSTLVMFSKLVWDNILTLNTQMTVYSALLYGNESWTLYSRQERRLKSFHMRSLVRILGIKWSARITNNEVLRRAATQHVYSATTASPSLLLRFKEVCERD